MKNLMATGFFLASAWLVGCEERPQGTYYNLENRSEYIQLKEDGVFHLHAGDAALSGKYLISRNNIILNPDGKIEARGQIEKGMIIDHDGTRWRKF